MDRIGIDWQRVCLDLRTHYGPLSKVATMVGSDWRHINRLARGEVDEPRFSVGVRLADLWHDATSLGDHPTVPGANNK